MLVEKPFARSRYECDELIKIANDNGVVLAVFQQTFFAPFYVFAYELMRSGKLGDIKQISIRYNGLSRRWDWQTLQKRCAGSTYNTGPHPIGMALGFIDFDKNAKVVYSKLDTALTSGDADDYAKILIAAPEKPLVEPYDGTLTDEDKPEISWLEGNNVAKQIFEHNFDKSTGEGEIIITLNPLDNNVIHQGRLFIKKGRLHRTIEIALISKQNFTPSWIDTQIYSNNTGEFVTLKFQN